MSGKTFVVVSNTVISASVPRTSAVRNGAVKYAIPPHVTDVKYTASDAPLVWYLNRYVPFVAVRMESSGACVSVSERPTRCRVTTTPGTAARPVLSAVDCGRSAVAAFAAPASGGALNTTRTTRPCTSRASCALTDAVDSAAKKNTAAVRRATAVTEGRKV